MQFGKHFHQLSTWVTAPLLLAYTLLVLESAVHSTGWQVDAVVQKHLIVSFRMAWPEFLANLTIPEDMMPPPGAAEGGGEGGEGGEGAPAGGEGGGGGEGGEAAPAGGEGAPAGGEGGEGGEGEMPMVPPGPAHFCLYARGLANNYQVINDRCQSLRWRPGQAWRFDANFTMGYQPIRIGQGLCLAAESAVVSAKLVVVDCPADSTKVDALAQWRVGRKEDDSVWFRNLRTRTCIRQHEGDNDGFTINQCKDELEFYYKLHNF